MRASSDYARRAEAIMEHLSKGPENRALDFQEAQVNATLAQAAAICELTALLSSRLEIKRQNLPAMGIGSGLGGAG